MIINLRANAWYGIGIIFLKRKKEKLVHVEKKRAGDKTER